MQYVGKVGGYVYNQWNSLNPATLSGAIDIIVVEHADGTMHCSPWHVRFGKFQIIKPTHKKVDLYVNDMKTSLPMKLSDGGEAFFVFETDASNLDLLSQSVLTSPVLSPVSSPGSSAANSPQMTSPNSDKTEPDTLDLNNEPSSLQDAGVEDKIGLSPATLEPSLHASSEFTFEEARRVTQQLNIPSKIDINGDMLLDMDGYKPNSQRNIHNSDEYFKKILLEKIQDSDTNDPASQKDASMDEEMKMLSKIITRDEDGSIRILHKYAHHFEAASDANSEPEGAASDVESTATRDNAESKPVIPKSPSKLQEQKFFKSLRLTSDQLKSMNLKYGENSLRFKIGLAGAQVTSNLYLWRAHTPIVISDIDGTITKSDALGHVLNMIGRDWTHLGVANLFLDIRLNGYNVLYLTARSVGQADTTRQYLKNVVQDGCKLPSGPVILSPDRTMAALRREVILKKPEVFKMACLNDIKSLYFDSNRGPRGNNVEGGEYGASSKGPSADVLYLDTNLQIELDTTEGGLSHAPECDDHDDEDDDRTPFYAGFGNRITDAISYRSVGIPSHRIFTINPNGEVHMELLELAGYKSSYLHIGELIDHFFPPIKEVSTLNTYWNNNQLYEYMSQKDQFTDSPNLPGNQSPSHDLNTLGSPGGSISGGYMAPGSNSQAYGAASIVSRMKTDEKFSDVNYWREPINLSDLENEEEDNEKNTLNARFNSPELTPLRSADELFLEPVSPSRNSGSSPLSARRLDKVVNAGKLNDSSDERPVSRTSAFSSPLKEFMMLGGKKELSAEKHVQEQQPAEPGADSDYTEDEDYSDDDYDEEDEDYDDTDGDEEEDGDLDEDFDENQEVDVDEDLDVDGDDNDVAVKEDMDDDIDDDYDEDAADIPGEIGLFEKSTPLPKSGENNAPQSSPTHNVKNLDATFSTAADQMSRLSL